MNAESCWEIKCEQHNSSLLQYRNNVLIDLNRFHALTSTRIVCRLVYPPIASQCAPFVRLCHVGEQTVSGVQTAVCTHSPIRSRTLSKCIQRHIPVAMWIHRITRFFRIQPIIIRVCVCVYLRMPVRSQRGCTFQVTGCISNCLLDTIHG